MDSDDEDRNISWHSGKFRLKIEGDSDNLMLMSLYRIKSLLSRILRQLRLPDDILTGYSEQTWINFAYFKT